MIRQYHTFDKGDKVEIQKPGSFTSRGKVVETDQACIDPRVKVRVSSWATGPEEVWVRNKYLRPDTGD